MKQHHLEVKRCNDFVVGRFDHVVINCRDVEGDPGDRRLPIAFQSG